MESSFLSKEIESLNEELYQHLHSKEYLECKKISNLKRALLHLDITKIKDVLKYRRLDFIARKRKLIHTKNIWFNSGSSENFDSSSVIYTCITGGYDELQTPVLYGKYPMPVFFTDHETHVKGWSLCLINDWLKQYSNCQINRYIKLHPFDYFQNNDFSIYIDGNIKVYGDVRPLFSIARKAKSGLAIHLHSDRDCIYDEAEICSIYGRGKVEGIRRQIARYHKNGFPEHYGLLEAGIIVTDLKNALAKEILEKWWEEYLISESERDQLALPYVLWSMGLNIDDIGILGTSLRQNPKFRIVNHNH